MREIKFRAWDGESNKMIFWSLNDLLVRFGEPEYQFGVEDRPSVFFNWMQFTGLKDKNGKEIYEGDIIFHEDGEFSWHGIVKWSEDECFFYADLWKENYTLQTEFVEDIHEIIGNIYENSELLK